MLHIMLMYLLSSAVPFVRRSTTGFSGETTLISKALKLASNEN